MKKIELSLMAAAIPVAVFLSACALKPPGQGGNDSVRILTWNCQTLFDDVSDGTEYDGYDPGRDGWTSELYRKKLTNIASVIKAGIPGGPEIVALQEIENGRVLRALAEDFLSGMGYAYTAVTSVPGIALQTGFLSRLEIRRSVSHGIARGPSSESLLRNILEAEFVSGDRTLIVFNNHWKSKAGDADSVTEPIRIRYAAALSDRMREIGELLPGTDIVALGDLNESADEYSRAGKSSQTALMPGDVPVPASREADSLFLMPVPGGAKAGLPDVQGARVFCLDPWSVSDFPGSYWYKGEWLSIDHTLLAPSLFDGRAFEFAGFRVVHESPGSTADGKPFRWDTYRGDGYSDHFPLLLTLKLERD